MQYLSGTEIAYPSEETEFSPGCNWSKTTDASSGAGTAYPSRIHDSSPGFSEVRAAQTLVFCVVLYKLLFILWFFFLLTIMSVLLRFTDSDYPFDIAKLFTVLFYVNPYLQDITIVHLGIHPV